jgi:hypothetical protein
MVTDWWQEHPKVKCLEGAPWLVGFHCHMKEDIHTLDRDYLEELVTWNEGKESIE